MEMDHNECAICYSFMVEPVRLACNHVYCLTCLEKLILDNNLKCPLDRKEFDFEQDLTYDEEIQQNNYQKNKVDFEKRALQILKASEENKNLTEMQLVYGNLHKLINSSENNKHEWQCYVTLNKNQGRIKNAIDKMNSNEKLSSLLGIEYTKLKTLKSEYKELDIKELDVIKSVEFKLHPTFNPPSVTITKPPFKLARIGWGTFGIEIVIVFQAHLNMKSIQVEHILSFSADNTFNNISVFVDVDKIREFKALK